MILLAGSKINKSYGAHQILKDINLQIRSNERVALIGDNGSGKTTLMRILANDLEKDSGVVSIRQDLKIGYLPQRQEFEGKGSLWDFCMEIFESTIELGEELEVLAEEVAEAAENDENYEFALEKYQRAVEKYEEEDGYRIESDIKGVLKGLGFSEEQYKQDVEKFSGGQKSRVLLARTLLQKPNILLMDEPTNHLDLEAVKWLEGFLKDFEGALLIISHDRYFLDAICTRVLYLFNKLESYDGDYTSFMKERKKRLEVRAHQYAQQEREIKRQKEIIERFENYGGARYHIQAKSRRRLLDQMELIEKPDTNRQANFKFEPKLASGKDVLDVEDLSMSFGDTKLFENLNLYISRGERVGIIGPNGIGKTTFFKIIRRELKQKSGYFDWGAGVRLGFLDQEQKDLIGNMSILEEIMEIRPDLKIGEIRNILASFLFYGEDVFKNVDDLSGGERSRVALCKMMLSDANTLLLDEPTNHLDIDSKEALENACKLYEGTLIFISHDRYFLNQVADRIVLFDEDGFHSYLGNYDYYVEKSAPEKEEVEEVNRTAQQREKRKTRAERAKKRAIKAEKEELENKIERLENSLNKIDIELSEPEIYTIHEKVRELAEKRKKIESSLEIAYEEWFLID